MQLELLNDQGQAIAKVDAPGHRVRPRLQTERWCIRSWWPIQANARQGTRAQMDRARSQALDARSRSRQKGTGRARAGMTSAAVAWRWLASSRTGRDENFSQKINKKMYRAGMASDPVRSWRVTAVWRSVGIMVDRAEDQAAGAEAQGA